MCWVDVVGVGFVGVGVVVDLVGDFVVDVGGGDDLL